MSAHTLSPGLWSSFGDMFSGLTRRCTPQPPAASAADDARADRDFLTDVMSNAPDAFSSELDVQSMMLLYPGRY